MGSQNDPIRNGIEDFAAPVAQMFRNIGTSISDTISDLGDAVSKSENESTHGSDNVEQKGGCLKPILYLIAIVLLFNMCGTEEEYDPASDIAMVQSGYLGEYTDVPVQELLWFLYSNVSDSQEWEGFICDDGYPIVQVTYSRNDEPDSPAIFQFSIADQQFVLSGYRDPHAEVEEITDLYALLNYTYLEWRSQYYSGDFPYDPSLIDELNDISGSSIMYGASKSYTGDRSTLNQDYGEELLPLSVPWLLDNYGYIDMAMYPEVPYNEQAFGGNIETSQGTQTELHLLDNLLAYAEKYDIELFRFEEEQNLAQWLETLDQELTYVQEDNIFGAPRYKRTEDRSHYVYCGELQENQPNGYGILFGPTDENDGIMSYNEWSYDILYIGEFKDDLDGAHAAVPELDMGLGVVAGDEVDFGGAFVVQGLLGGVVVKAPVGERRGDDDRLVEEAALEAIFCAAVKDALAQICFCLSAPKLCGGFSGQDTLHLGFFGAGGTEADEGFADLRIWLGWKGDLRLPAAFQTYTS